VIYWLGVTDNDWFRFLSQIDPEDINFWQPGGRTFKVLPQGGIFLFKLKSPTNAIGGVGFFSSQSRLPLSIAWDTFNIRNGCSSYEQFEKKIRSYRRDENPNPEIGCIVLTSPIFWKREDWIPIPENWSTNIVTGKAYSTKDEIGGRLWNQVEERLHKYQQQLIGPKIGEELMVSEPTVPYGTPSLMKVRLGQGAFRVLVIDGYSRRCAISGEKTLPVLEAAHIKSYAKSGPHALSNGLLLRSDMHKLFDTGYITVTTELKVEVSKRIKEEFDNGKEYYKYHGSSLLYLPNEIKEQPNPLYLDWHNTQCYKG
jgi:putative restriction endonuclease